jgi:hypothetical protein
MTELIEKLTFASQEWVDVARGVLEEIVAEHGEIGRSFAVCEVFTDAPMGLVGPDPTTAAWHYRIVDMTVTVGVGAIDDADQSVTIDYEQVLAIARMVYTPEIVEKARDKRRRDLDMSKPMPPEYLVELHNRMAAITA